MTERRRKLLRAGAATLALGSGTVGIAVGVADQSRGDQHRDQNRSTITLLDSAADYLSNEPITIFSPREGYTHVPASERVPALAKLQLEKVRHELTEQGRNTEGVEELINRASSARTAAEYETASRSTHELANSLRRPPFRTRSALAIFGAIVGVALGITETLYLSKPKRSLPKR